MPNQENPPAWGTPPAALLAVLRYSMAAVMVATALLWSVILHPVLSSAYLLLFLVAVMVSGWFGRGGPGLLAAFLSALAVDYFFFPPIGQFQISVEAVPYFLSFVLSAVAASWLSAAHGKAENQRQAHLDELFEQAPEAIMLLDLQARAMRVNKEFCRLFGYRREEVLGKSGMDLIVPPELQEEAARTRERLLRGESAGLETLRKRKDGALLSVSELGVPIIVDGERIADYVIFRDITERKNAAEALMQAQAELAHLSRVTTMGELVASIAHEVNQPIGAIVTAGNAANRWLATNPPNVEEVREALGDIIADANRAAAVIGRIRALLKKNTPEMAAVDINEVIRSALFLIDNEMHRAGVAPHVELAADLPAVLGDRVQLQQVLLNLIMNGIEAMNTVAEGPRELRIQSTIDDEDVLIQVQDSGIGLNGQNGDRIFEPFFTTKPQGIGMGLSISRSIIEAHGGRLWTKPASCPGAVFCFTLPKADHLP